MSAGGADRNGAESRSSEDGYSAKMSMFDELLESGGTMKVSLTPDRMKVFEVCFDLLRVLLHSVKVYSEH